MKVWKSYQRYLALTDCYLPSSLRRNTTAVRCPVSKIRWAVEHEHGGEKVAGHFTSISFGTLSLWHLKTIKAILELLSMMWEKRSEKGMQEQHSETLIIIFLALFKGRRWDCCTCCFTSLYKNPDESELKTCSLFQCVQSNWCLCADSGGINHCTQRTQKCI